MIYVIRTLSRHLQKKQHQKQQEWSGIYEESQASYAYCGDKSEEGNWDRYMHVKTPVKYQNPSGNIVVVDDILLLFLAMGVCISEVMTLNQLRLEENQKKLRRANQVLYKKTIYRKLVLCKKIK